jgi:hypothetical protein
MAETKINSNSTLKINNFKSNKFLVKKNRFGQISCSSDSQSLIRTVDKENKETQKKLPLSTASISLSKQSLFSSGDIKNCANLYINS